MNEKKVDEGVLEFTLRDFYFIIFRHKKKTISLFFLVIAAFSLYTYKIPDVYLSEAQLLVKVGRENLDVIPTADQSRAFTMSRNQRQDLYTEIEILKSRDVFEELVNEIGVDTFLGNSDVIKSNIFGSTEIDISDISENAQSEIPSGIPEIQNQYSQIHDFIVSYLMEKVIIDTKRESNIITIQFASVRPEMAHMVVSKLIEIFIEHHMKVHYANNQYDFFNDQANNAKIALNEIESKLTEIKNKLDISSLDKYQTILLGRIESLRMGIDNNQTAFVETQSKIKSLKNALEKLPETVEMERITGNENTLNKLYELQLREHELLSKYSEDNFQVKEIRDQIKEAKKLLNDESQVNQGINSTYQSLQQELITEQTKFESLMAINKEQKDMLDKTQEELRKLNDLELEISQLEREKEIQSANYSKYTGSLEEARIDQVVQQQKLSNISVLQPATQPVRPLATRKRRNIAMGLFLGVFGAIGIAIVSEFLDHTIKRQEDVEKWLQLRTLAIIPLYTDKKRTIKKITPQINKKAVNNGMLKK